MADSPPTYRLEVKAEGPGPPAEVRLRRKKCGFEQVTDELFLDENEGNKPYIVMAKRVATA